MTRRRWAADRLALRAAFAGRCRVCSESITKDESVWRWLWREERGQGHADCGFYASHADTDDDRRAVTCARALVALQPYATIPREVADEGALLGIVTRANGNVSPSPLGFALLKHLRAASQAAPSPGVRSDNNVGPAFQLDGDVASGAARRAGAR